MLPHRRHRHDGERLVHLVEVDALRGPPGPGVHLRDRADGRGREVARRRRVHRMRDDRRQRLQAALPGGRAAHQHERRRAVRDRARVRGGHRPVLPERGPERRDLVGRRLRGLLVLVDHDLALAAGDRHRSDLPGERAVVVRRERPRERRQREAVLLLARERELRGAVLGEGAHQAALVVCVLEAVEEHVVADRLVAHPVAGAGLRQQVRRVGHRLHAARDDHVVRSAREHVVREDRGLHRRAAHLVDRRAGDRLREPRLERRLTRGGLSLPRRQHAAHDRLVDVAGLEARTLDRRADRHRSEVAGRQRREVAHESAHRRSRRAHDYDRIVQHGDFSGEVVTNVSRESTERKRSESNGCCSPERHHFVSLNNSRPISILRISDVPAPIS